MGDTQFGQGPVCSASEIDQDLTLVLGILPSFDQAIRNEPVDKLNRTIVSDTETFGQDTNYNVSSGRTFDGKQRLMLLGTQPHLRCRVFAELQKAAQMITKLG